MFDELREKLIKDGARHFVDLPVEFAFFDEVAEHAEALDGVEVTEFMTDGIIHMWMEFEFRGRKFSVYNNYTDYLFYVDGPVCREPVLLEIIEHFRKLTEQ